MGINVAGIPRGWKWGLWRSAGIEFVVAGTTRVRFRNLADDKYSGAFVRILGKLSCEISCAVAKYIVDSGVTVFLSCCKKRRSDAGQLQYVLSVKF